MVKSYINIKLPAELTKEVDTLIEDLGLQVTPSPSGLNP